jgi:hypothetical protein
MLRQECRSRPSRHRRPSPHSDPVPAKELYALFRDQYNPELSLPDGTVEELLAVGMFRSRKKEKRTPLPQVRDWSLTKKALPP